MIWNNIYRLLKPYFEESTGQLFTSGIKVLVKVTVQFHELYGYSLTVLDIDLLIPWEIWRVAVVRYCCNWKKKEY
mgnify:FL=1